ncbi:hypothetical protein WT67_27035 [Burkholderia stagnalis]|uniref:Uncharacterized protein n=1 Tax=Burkholderia stagnalis TaxID=1503054 RepID=A0A119WVT6_9BURK|nr:hypothetical protein WT02_31865 [Burkholderia stagnalis]KVL89038.1 hypothetical protein WT03_24135 [Burkholderia stagnalis]KVM06545.1 hypothetical protein WT04_22720 [Burkholderia stagnalis]KVO42000.1 hypothetical protein WT17_15235 [Burkholderia stagnalis]KVO78239.1 hypothetical protein WT19_06540 [Burkholderia stagnalis]
MRHVLLLAREAAGGARTLSTNERSPPRRVGRDRLLIDEWGNARRRGTRDQAGRARARTGER